MTTNQFTAGMQVNCRNSNDDIEIGTVVSVGRTHVIVQLADGRGAFSLCDVRAV